MGESEKGIRNKRGKEKEGKAGHRVKKKRERGDGIAGKRKMGQWEIRKMGQRGKSKRKGIKRQGE